MQNIIQWFVLSQRLIGKVGDIRNYQDIHKGQRCFIIGNGPSVNNTNFSLIKNEIVFGTNRLYETLTSLKINCTYYVTSNKHLMYVSFNDFCALDLPFFLGQHAAEAYAQKYVKTKKEFKKKPIILQYKRRLMWEGNKMSTDLSRGTSDGDTVVIDCLQIAYYMGFKKVYLLGCDCDFSAKGHFYSEIPENYKIESEEVPRWFESYKICKKTYEADGREIINATVGGKLEVFTRQSLGEIMKIKKINKEKSYRTTHET
jgi:hypothetical protein